MSGKRISWGWLAWWAFSFVALVVVYVGFEFALEWAA